MKNPNMYLTAAFIIAVSVLLIIPLWAIFGVLLPEEGGGHAHGSGDMVMAPSCISIESSSSWLIEDIPRKLYARNKKKLQNRFCEIWQKV